MNDEAAPRTPGELLRSAREARGLSLAEVSECTKIPLRLVEAMERDEYHKLSGGLYVKSFLRTYAGCVGLDAEELLAGYDRAVGADAGAAPTAPADRVWAEEETTVRRVGVAAGALLGRVAVVLGVLTLVGLLVWRLVFAGRGG
jgi:cytoskeletal protein RodZ